MTSSVAENGTNSVAAPGQIAWQITRLFGRSEAMGVYPVIFTGILQLFFIVILHPLPCHAPDRSYNEALPCRRHLHDVNRHLIKVQDIDEDLV